MPRQAQLFGVVKLRQVYSKHGHVYCAMSVPAGVQRELGWAPGQLLTYYIAKDSDGRRSLKLMLQEDLLPVFEDMDHDSIARAEERKGPRPGSIAAREVEVTEALERAIRGDRDPEAEPRHRSDRKRKKHRSR